MLELLIRRWTSPDRLDEIITMVHAAFAHFVPPSGVLKESGAALAQRPSDGFVLVAMEDDQFVGSVFCAEKDGGLYLTRMATRPDRQGRGTRVALLHDGE